MQDYEIIVPKDCAGYDRLTESGGVDVVQAVLDGAADAAFMRTYSAQYFANNDRTNSLRFDMVNADQTVFSMYTQTAAIMS